MRLWILLLLCVIFAGCKTISPQSDREIALMRAEILDLESLYGDLKSRHRRALSELATCKGEPVSDYRPEFDETYYHGEQIIGSGIIHTGTPECCAECEATYYGEVIIQDSSMGRSVLPSQTPINLEPQPAEQAPRINPITQPFGDERPTIPSEPNINGGTTLRSNLPPEHQYLASNQTSRGQWNQRSEQFIPDAEPGFRPDSQWNPRSRRDARDSSDLNIELGLESNQPSWQKTAALNNISGDERFLAGELAMNDGSGGQIKQLLINPKHTYGKDYDQNGEDDGIQILIQPLDSRGQVINRAADLVVSIMDPSEVGDAQRIGLWKMESYQVESSVSNDPERPGLILDLPWQRRTPARKDLVVFVRYTSNSGQELETSLDIRIAPPKSGNREIQDSVANQSATQRRDSSKSNRTTNVPEWRPVR